MNKMPKLENQGWFVRKIWTRV